MTGTADEAGYSVENAHRFGWASVAPKLNPERVELLARTVVGPAVLDAGCGGGGYVDHLTRAGFAATGVDKYDMFLALAADRGLAGRFIQADLTDRLPFPDKAFDTAVCFDVLEHVDDAAALRELARVTRSRIVLTVPRDMGNLESDYRLCLPTYKDPTHLRYYTADMVRELAATVAPRSVEVFPEAPVDVLRFVSETVAPHSRRPLLSAVYRRAFAFLLRRVSPPELSLNWAAVLTLDGGAAG